MQLVILSSKCPQIIAKIEAQSQTLLKQPRLFILKISKCCTAKSSCAMQLHLDLLAVCDDDGVQTILGLFGHD